MKEIFIMWIIIYLIVYIACTFVNENHKWYVFIPINVFLIALLPIWIFLIKPPLSIIWKIKN